MDIVRFFYLVRDELYRRHRAAVYLVRCQSIQERTATATQKKIKKGIIKFFKREAVR